MANQPASDTGRHYGGNDDLQVPAKEGCPPKPATEPKGSEGSSRTPKTATDPATGEPN